MKKSIILFFLTCFFFVFYGCNSPRYVKYQNRAYKKVYHPIEKTKEFKSYNKYQKDFLILAHLVKDAYPNYQEFLTEEDWRKVLQNSLDRLHDANLQTAVFEYQKFLALLKNNHTEVSYPSILSIEERIFLFAPYYLNKRWILFDIHKSYPQSLITSELLAINDIPTDTVYEKLKLYICAESDELLYHSAYSEIMFGRPKLLQHLGILPPSNPDSLKLTVRLSENIVQDITIPSVNLRNDINWIENGYGTRQSVVKTDSGYVYRFFPEHNLAYLQLNSFLDRLSFVIGIKREVPFVFWPFAFNMLRKAYQGKPSARMRSVLPGTQNITTFYEDFFTKLKESNSKHLVIDVRNNFGGDIFYTYQLLSFLTEQSDLKTYSRFIKYSDFYKQIEDVKKIEKNYSSLEKSLIVHDTLLNISSMEEDYNIFKKMKDPSFPYYVNTTDKVFKGNVFVLTSHYSASAATVFPVLIQDNNLGTIIGRTPANRTAKQNSFSKFRLPNSSIVVSLSTLYFIRPDASNTDLILQPDHYVPVRLSRDDYTFDYLLNLIKNME